MIFINIKELIPLVPDMIDLFLSGLLFLVIYSWLNTKTYNISLMIIWSLFISYIIKTFYGILPVNLNSPLKSIIYIVTGTVLPFFFTWVKQTKFVKRITPYFNHKSINDDIFDDVIDYEMGTIMSVYLKSSNIYYAGRFAYREEKGNESWISLYKYNVVNKKTNEIIYNSEKAELKSSVVIPLSNVESIELIYEENSKVWSRMMGK